jgi:hypothetical protein
VDVTDTGDSDTGTLRDVLTNTTENTVTLPGSTITIATGSAAINPGNSVTELKGQAGYLDTLASALLANANSFIEDFLKDPAPSDWNTYFGSGGTFDTAVNDAINDTALSDVSVITMDKSNPEGYRENPIINDTRGTGYALAYTNVAFKDFKITHNDSNIAGGGVVSASSNASAAAIGDISYSLFTRNNVTVSGTYNSLGGGGVMGALSTSSSAAIGDISYSLFTGNNVTGSGTYSTLDGGGVVGAYSSTSTAIIGDISYSLFTGNDVTITSSNINGGGVVGAIAYYDSATVGNIMNSLFTGN